MANNAAPTGGSGDLVIYTSMAPQRQLDLTLHLLNDASAEPPMIAETYVRECCMFARSRRRWWGIARAQVETAWMSRTDGHTKRSPQATSGDARRPSADEGDLDRESGSVESIKVSSADCRSVPAFEFCPRPDLPASNTC